MLAQLEDQARPRPYSEIRLVLESELGAETVDHVFSEFDQKATAAASLAQVWICPGRSARHSWHWFNTMMHALTHWRLVGIMIVVFHLRCTGLAFQLARRWPSSFNILA